ncbi:MAG: FmdB family zinc ribbon protein [Thermodesulfobacteriota bacterium]
MPIYEYECMQCGVHEEVFQKLSEKPLKKCSHCSGKLHKLISQSSFHLKGSGWYVTDYANSSKNAASGEKKSSADSPEPKKAESKAADKKAD